MPGKHPKGRTTLPGGQPPEDDPNWDPVRTSREEYLRFQALEDMLQERKLGAWAPHRNVVDFLAPIQVPEGTPGAVSRPLGGGYMLSVPNPKARTYDEWLTYNPVLADVIVQLARIPDNPWYGFVPPS